MSHYLNEMNVEGILVELFGEEGCGKTDLVVQILEENQTFKAAWIEEEFSLYPYALLERKILSERILYVDWSSSATQKDLFWVAHQVLKSQLFQMIVIHFKKRMNQKNIENELRRLQIATRKTGATIFLLNTLPTREGNWPIAIQVEVKRKPNPQHNSDALLLRYLKGGEKYQWRLGKEWLVSS